jgi:hypothetical protein
MTGPLDIRMVYVMGKAIGYVRPIPGGWRAYSYATKAGRDGTFTAAGAAAWVEDQAVQATTGAMARPARY